MISLLHHCVLMVDNGYFFEDDPDNEWISDWCEEMFFAGEEIDETDKNIDTNNLTEGEDFVRL